MMSASASVAPPGATTYLPEPSERGHLSARDGVRLTYYVWEASDPRAVVLVAHGYGEHARRYQYLVEALVPAGITVIGWDMRGHGESGGRRVHVDRYAIYDNDLRDLIGLCRQRWDLPLVLFGHSQGGLIACRVLTESPEIVDASVISSPALRVRAEVPAWKQVLGRFSSNLVPTLSIPSGLPPDSISRDPAEVRRYATDPLVQSKATARWYTEFTAAQDDLLARAPSLVAAPMLALVGTGDPLIDAATSIDFFGRVGSADCELRTFADHYHELINEAPEHRNPILEIVRDWVLARVQVVAGR